jgi:hypothetical protein
MVSVMVRGKEGEPEGERDTDTVSKTPLLSLVKLVQHTVGLAFIVYDSLTLDPPGGGTKGLAFCACAGEIFLIFTEVIIYTASKELVSKYWSKVGYNPKSSRVTPENN